MRRLRHRLAATIGLALLLACSAAADGVRILETDREAVEARVEIVLGARQELLVSSFVFGNDELTMTALAMLRDSARRGVKVRVIVDAMWNKVPSPLLAALRSDGVEIRQFHPFRFRHPTWVFRRMHDKLIIADGELLVAGGRNIQSTYFGFGHQIDAPNYIDTDLLVRGDAAAEARRYFLALWDSEDVRPLTPKGTAEEIAKGTQELDRHKAWLDARVAEALNDPDRRVPPLIEVESVRFLHDPVDGRDAPKVGPELRTLLDSARDSVLIESPYLVPTRGMRAGFRAALNRGVRIRIVTNSLASTDNLWAQAGYVGEKASLVKSGVELWEYDGPETLHSKSAVIDDQLVIVGSYNLDPRSQNLNREVALVLRDERVAADLKGRMDEHLQRATRIDERGFPAGSNEKYPGVPRSKVCKLRLMQLIAPLVRGQL